MGTASSVVKPTAMSNDVQSLEVHGTALAQGATATVAATPGTVVAVELVSPDGHSTSAYRFTLAAA